MKARKILGIVLVVLLAAYLLTGVVEVRPGERAVVRRFGRVLEEKPEPGLWVGLPWGMDRVDRVVVDQVRTVNVGYSDELADRAMPPGQLLTGDHNLVNVQVAMLYRVRPDEVADFVIQGDRVNGLLERIVEVSMAEWVAARTVDQVLLQGKTRLGGEVLRQARARVEPYRLGVELLDARVTLVAPPDEVKDDFDRVARAQTRMATLRYQAEQEAASRVRLARSDRFRIEQRTAAFVHGRKLLARREAERFVERLRQYRAGGARNPQYLRQIWEEERGKVFARLKEGGRLDLLDHHLGSGGLDVFTAPLLPKP
jgi:membrane protease subunit HflK